MRRGVRPTFSGRGRERSWWLVAAAAAVTAFAGLAQVWHLPVHQRVGIAVLAPVLALVTSEFRARAAQDDTRDRLLTGRVAVSGGRGRLPRVSEVDPNRLRVHAARLAVPYVARDRQADVAEALGPGGAVLVVGHSMAGKTRLVVELLRAQFADAPLLVPESGPALREVIDSGLSPTDTVVLLDDLERFLGDDGLTVGLLEQLTVAGAVVAATIRTDVLDRYAPRDQMRPPEWEVLRRFAHVDLQRMLSGQEHGRLRAQITDAAVLASVERYGLAEYLGAGPDAVAKFEHGETVAPVGHAVVRAAVDWRRVGFVRPIPRAVLSAALPTYLAHRDDVAWDPEALDRALGWATEKINETVALLRRADEKRCGEAFEAFEYLVDYVTARADPVPDGMWLLAVEAADWSESIGLGYAAYKEGRFAVAEEACRCASYSGDSAAVRTLAEMLERREGPDEASSQSRDARPGMMALRSLLDQQQAAAAEAVYRREADHGNVAAMICLAVLLAQRGDTAEAQLWVRRATSDHGRADEGRMPLPATRLVT
jgi:hypothetical protein